MNERQQEIDYQFTLARLFWWVTGTACVIAVLVWLTSSVQVAQRAAQRMQAQSPLNQLQLALHNYHTTYGQFPPAYVTDLSGQPMHSWRVLILPFIEHKALYDAYDFGEPWDGPNNSKLANRMPRIFCSPTEPESHRFTNMAVITGPGTAFPGARSTSLAEFRDGRENTILLAELADSKIPWLEPRDLIATQQVQSKQQSTNSVGDIGLQISAVEWRLPYVVFADGIHAYAIDPSMPRESLQALFTIAGDEKISRDQLQKQGYLQ